MDPERLKYIFFRKDIFPWLRWPLPRSNRWQRAFLHQLASCVDAGIDLRESLDACMKGGCPREMRNALIEVKAALEEGEYLSHALKTHASKVFARPLLDIIEIGEDSGRLAETLRILDSGYDNLLSVRLKVQGAFIYPIMLFTFGTVLLLFVTTNVVPTFAEIFSDMGAAIPPPTRVIVALSNLIRSGLLPLLLFLACLALALTLFFRLARRVAKFNNLFFRIPFFGPLIYHSNLFYFSSLMSMLLGSGAPTHDALLLLDNKIVWPIFKDAIEKMRHDISEGRAFSEALAKREIFSPTFVWLTSVGEQKGDLSDSLKAAAEYEVMAIRNIAAQVRLFQPIAVVLMGIMIGFVIIALGMPIMRISYLLF